MDLIFQVNEALVPRRDKGSKHLPHWHDAVSHRDLALFALEVREVFHVRGSIPFTAFNTSTGEGHNLIFRPVIVMPSRDAQSRVVSLLLDKNRNGRTKL